MKILTFLAERFRWTTHSKTLPEVDDVEVDEEVRDAVVVFLHIEARDEEQRARVFRHTLKHIKWLANKRDLERVVLHSFTHLGGDNADPAFARTFIDELVDRLSGGYQVSTTPFGYFCAWEISVHGESLAKVWKEV